MNKYNLNDQYKKFLALTGVTEEQFHAAQKRETKRAFMGGVGMLLDLMGNDLADLPEDKAIEKLGLLHDQVKAFWITEAAK